MNTPNVKKIRKSHKPVYPDYISFTISKIPAIGTTSTHIKSIIQDWHISPDEIHQLTNKTSEH